MNYSARYVLNPNYRLLDDVKRSLIIAVDKDDEIQSIKYTRGIITRIHPLHAQILSFFDGENHNVHSILFLYFFSVNG